MWKNYLIVAVRSVKKQPTYSAINLMGLAMGLACTFLILMFVRDEHSYDTYHNDADRIYRMITGTGDDSYDGIAKVNGAWGVATATQIPAVESLARFTFFGQAQFQLDDRIEYVSGGLYADSTTFDVFSWEVILGDPATALIEPYSLVLTKTLATSWFGNGNAVGERIVIGGENEYTVTAVLEDVPENSHFGFRFLTSYSGYDDERHDDWIGWNQYYTYLKLFPGSDVESVASASTDLVAANMTEDQSASFDAVTLQPLSDIYLRSNMFREIGATGNERTVTVFMIMALFILLIAAVNFINLSTARSSLRAREVGIRKSLGARRSRLIMQFVTESVVTVFIAAVLAGLLVAAFLPSFNDMSGKTFTFLALLTPTVLMQSVLLVTVIGIVAGLYPALVMSAFNPSRMMKGAISTRGAISLRKGLVGLQFVISAALIMGTGVVSDQLDYIQEIPLGFERENIVGIPFRDEALQPLQQTMRDEMALVPGVEEIAISANRPGGGDYGIPIEIPGRERVDVPSVRILIADYDYVDVYRMNVVAGRSFSIDRPSDKESAVMINEAMASKLGWDDPLGEPILMPAIGREFKVIGVLEDFHYRSLHESIEPLILFMAPSNWYTMLNVRINPASVTETLEALAPIYEKYDVNNPFTFTFISDRLNGLYIADRRVEELLSVFTLLAILIACLGLFGLSTFTAERRRAEIGIRKVVGATETRIILMLTKETAILVATALVIAIPIVVYFGRDWLESFAYSGGINIGTLIAGSVIAFAVALLATGAQAWRAARMNPITAIRVD